MTNVPAAAFRIRNAGRSLGLAAGVVLLVAAGCLDPTADEPNVRATANGSLVPVAAAEVAGTVPQGTVVAAMVNRTSGGIAGWSSGASGVMLFSDGIVFTFWAQPWGPAPPMQHGACPEVYRQTLAAAGRSLGANGTLDCVADRLTRLTLTRMPPEAMSEIRASLAGRDVAVPPAHQGPQDPCCDRVFTERRIWLEGQESFLVDEQQSGPPAPVTPDVDRLLAQLRALELWQDGLQ